MRKLMMTVAAVAGLALTAGCKRDEVQKERQDLAEAQQEAQKEITDIRQNAAEKGTGLRAEDQEEIAEAQQDVAEEQAELSQAEHERLAEQRKDSAGTVAANATVQGRVQSTMGDSLVILVPGSNAEMKLKTDDQTRVTQNNLAVELDDFEEGTEVRASFVTKGDDKVARDVVIIAPVMEK
ncbi:hypothetical protein [Hyalangium rubrum]|uniref:Lipoprotein n=1 Tax=Hyalangium rubrum TaxID=3103134 RepID=A0ABU5HD04_9BACT|nr:hypothetical protein [Hyalangium sp. s54d21]MDY7230713.1 hypothetical protein [Hyalangium sp. s54d21]